MKTLVTIIMFAAIVLLAPGCSSSEPRVSGIGFFDRRNVFVGDTVTISLPVDPESGDGWRVTRFDSAIIRPQPGSGAMDGRSVTFKFTAATPGEAELVFNRIRNERTTDQQRQFKIIVRSKL